MIVVSGETETMYYYHFDGLGSVVALSDENQNIVEQYEYDVFGEPNRTSDVNNPYMFTGRRYDDEAEFYYYRARYYRPNIGRFLQTDPIGYDDGLNMYLYVHNNSINSTDPSGKRGILPTDHIGMDAFVLLQKRRAIKYVEKAKGIKVNEAERKVIERCNAAASYEAYKSRSRAIMGTLRKWPDLSEIEQWPDDSIYNAYLHARWNAEMTRSIGIIGAKAFADAHEDFPENNILGSKKRMDLYNNFIGRALASSHFNEGRTIDEIMEYALDQGLLVTNINDPRLYNWKDPSSCKK